jgi:hypothetical protein
VATGCLPKWNEYMYQYHAQVEGSIALYFEHYIVLHLSSNPIQLNVIHVLFVAVYANMSKLIINNIWFYIYLNLNYDLVTRVDKNCAVFNIKEKNKYRVVVLQSFGETKIR